MRSHHHVPLLSHTTCASAFGSDATCAGHLLSSRLRDPSSPVRAMFASVVIRRIARWGSAAWRSPPARHRPPSSRRCPRGRSWCSVQVQPVPSNACRLRRAAGQDPGSTARLHGVFQCPAVASPTTGHADRTHLVEVPRELSKARERGATVVRLVASAPASATPRIPLADGPLRPPRVKSPPAAGAKLDAAVISERNGAVSIEFDLVQPPGVVGQRVRPDIGLMNCARARVAMPPSLAWGSAHVRRRAGPARLVRAHANNRDVLLIPDGWLTHASTCRRSCRPTTTVRTAGAACASAPVVVSRARDRPAPREARPRA